MPVPIIRPPAASIVVDSRARLTMGERRRPMRRSRPGAKRERSASRMRPGRANERPACADVVHRPDPEPHRGCSEAEPHGPNASARRREPAGQIERSERGQHRKGDGNSKRATDCTNPGLPASSQRLNPTGKQRSKNLNVEKIVRSEPVAHRFRVEERQGRTWFRPLKIRSR